MMKKRELKKTVILLPLVLIILILLITRPIWGTSWKITKVSDEDVICFILYTLHDNVLKLTAQLYELDDDANRTVYLEIKRDGEWTQIAETQVVESIWIAPFRVENWDSTQNHEYRVVHGESATYTGLIRKDPVDEEEIVVAAFTGNGNQDRGPRPDIIANIKRQDPDILFFSGDQVYDHHDHFAAWLLFGRQFGEITRDRPTIVIPDDHDVGNDNLWGAGGEEGPGGYKDPEYVREVERAQTSHLPDPYDPTPIERDIGVYYTSLTWGRIGFAIVEDRKFKSQLGILNQEELEKKGLIFSRMDHLKQLPNPDLVDVPEAKLLGERQLDFLQEWTTDWAGQDMKVFLSQTVFANIAQLHGPLATRLAADLDSNGWPQSGRDRALREIRKGFALMIAGDQHLGTVLQHGIEEWNDAGFSFSVPSIVNRYERWWSPQEQQQHAQIEGSLEHIGEFKDGLGNKITMYAYANPNLWLLLKLNRWRAQAAGYGIVRLNKETREITMECWPRGCNVKDHNCNQYPGWPITIKQEDNYGKEPIGYLPTLEIHGQMNPVVQVIEEASGEIVYTLRINGTSYRPKVFREGKYTIRIGEGDSVQVLTGVESLGLQEFKIIRVYL